MNSTFPFLRLPVELQIQVLRHFYRSSFSIACYTYASGSVDIMGGGTREEVSLLWKSQILGSVARCALQANFAGRLECVVWGFSLGRIIHEVSKRKVPWDSIRRLDVFHPVYQPGISICHYGSFFTESFSPTQLSAVLPNLEHLTIMMPVLAPAHSVFKHEVEREYFEQGFCNETMRVWINELYLSSEAWFTDPLINGRRIKLQFAIDSSVLSKCQRLRIARFRTIFQSDVNGVLVVVRRDWIKRCSECRETARRYHPPSLSPVDVYDRVWNDEENIPTHGWMYDV